MYSECGNPTLSSCGRSSRRSGARQQHHPTLGGSISETEIVKKMLQVVHDHLEQVAISIETLLDVNDLTVEEVTGRLRNVEQRKKNTISAVDKEGRLLLTEEEWLARLKLRDDTGESNGPSSRKGSKKPWKSRRCMHGKEADQKKEESIDDGPIQCLYCGKRGHLSKNCWSKLRNKETAIYLSVLLSLLFYAFYLSSNNLLSTISSHRKERISLADYRNPTIDGTF